MTDPIIRHEGEVYQYVGDEVVITWKAKEGISRNNCVVCFFDIEENLKTHGPEFEKKYVLIPYFKAGKHLGEVTTGEIGSLKKVIVYTGDILNAASRIQALCKSYQRSLIVSKEIIAVLDDTSALALETLGSTQLRGREEPAELYSVSRTAVSLSA